MDKAGENQDNKTWLSSGSLPLEQGWTREFNNGEMMNSIT